MLALREVHYPKIDILIFFAIMHCMRLSQDFYCRAPMDVARDLVGAYLCRVTDDGKLIRARIAELELYTEQERGCHAYAGPTARNDAMFMRGGHAYVYLCYGLHNMLNIVVGESGYAAAVLIRALELPSCTGPGRLTKVLGVSRADNKMDLTSPNSTMWIEARDTTPKIISGPRIGIDYAGRDAELPWRFGIKDSCFISRPF